MVTVSGTNSTDLVGRYNMVQGLQESDIANLDDVASEVGSWAYFNEGSEAVHPHAASSGQPIPGQVSVPLTPSALSSHMSCLDGSVTPSALSSNLSSSDRSLASYNVYAVSSATTAATIQGPGRGKGKGGGYEKMEVKESKGK